VSGAPVSCTRCITWYRKTWHWTLVLIIANLGCFFLYVSNISVIPTVPSWFVPLKNLLAGLGRPLLSASAGCTVSIKLWYIENRFRSQPSWLIFNVQNCDLGYLSMLK